MGAIPPNKQISDNADSNSMCMKLIQLWLTSFAIGIPLLRLLFFFDFRNFEIVLAIFFTMLLFGTMYIFDESDRLWRVNDVRSCNEVTVTDGERINSRNISSKQRNEKFEKTVEAHPTTTNGINKQEATII